MATVPPPPVSVRWPMSHSDADDFQLYIFHYVQNDSSLLGLGDNELSRPPLSVRLAQTRAVTFSYLKYRKSDRRFSHPRQNGPKLIDGPVDLVLFLLKLDQFFPEAPA